VRLLVRREQWLVVAVAGLCVACGRWWDARWTEGSVIGNGRETVGCCNPPPRTVRWFLAGRGGSDRIGCLWRAALDATNPFVADGRQHHLSRKTKQHKVLEKLLGEKHDKSLLLYQKLSVAWQKSI